MPVPGPEEAWFWAYAGLTGLGELRYTCYRKLNDGIVDAFVERWHAETSSFHLPIGEMTITLDDVSCLLHIPCAGLPLDNKRVSKNEGINELVQYLGVDVADAEEELHDAKGAHVRFWWLGTQYLKLLTYARTVEDEEEREMWRVRTVRCYLLYLVGTTLFTDKSANYVDVKYLSLFEDLSSVHQYAWGPATLAWLYHYLGDSTFFKKAQICGYLCLLHVSL